MYKNSCSRGGSAGYLLVLNYKTNGSGGMYLRAAFK
jgi:hypothetical protein